MILHLAAINDREIRNLDVGSEYLEADIDINIDSRESSFFGGPRGSTD
jgi:hypothetical protein